MASTSTHASGTTFFDTIKKSFAEVPVDSSRDNAIETSAFLEASESLTTLFGLAILCLLASLKIFDLISLDVLGSVAFKPVKADILGNIKVGKLEAVTKDFLAADE